MIDQIVSLKQIHHRALKDQSEALEQKLSSSKGYKRSTMSKLSSSKDIIEEHRVF